MSTATFIVRRRNGESFTVLVDAEDYDRVMEVGGWFLDQRGYVVRNIPRADKRAGIRPTSIKLHRFILGLGVGDPEVDHRQGDKLDNRKRELRPATHTQNMQNVAAINGRGSSPYRGVSFHAPSGKWRARAQSNKRQIFLGLHPTPAAAFTAVQAWRSAHEPDAVR